VRLTLFFTFPLAFVLSVMVLTASLFIYDEVHATKEEMPNGTNTAFFFTFVFLVMSITFLLEGLV
jgi:hypothetical protein